MQIPIISGIYTDTDPALRTAYPVNMEPIPKNSGYSQGFLRVADGLLEEGTGPGICRGGIQWNGLEYRVMGTEFGYVQSGIFNSIGDVGGSAPVTFDYGFDFLAIASNQRLFLFDGDTLQENTDADLGRVVDVAWIDGYYVTTDGEFIISTDLNDPFSVRASRYASSEEDADPLIAVKKLGSELYAINRHTIETFTNIGGTGFPFQVIDGTQTYRGAIGTHAVTEFMGGLAFVGSGRNEQPGVHLATQGATAPISTSEIEIILSQYPEGELRQTVCETRMVERRELLYVHLPDCSLVYDGGASRALEMPVWFILKSDGGPYRGRYFVWDNNRWGVADTQSSKFGVISANTGDHWGDRVGWEFSTPVIFNESRSIICHELTLTAAIGSNIPATGAVVNMSFTEDGVGYAQNRGIDLSRRSVPLRWTRVGHFETQAAFRFQGDTGVRISAARLDAVVEGLM